MSTPTHPCDCGEFRRERLTPDQQRRLAEMCERMDLCGPGADLVEQELARTLLLRRGGGHYDDCPARKR